MDIIADFLDRVVAERAEIAKRAGGPSKSITRAPFPMPGGSTAPFPKISSAVPFPKTGSAIPFPKSDSTPPQAPAGGGPALQPPGGGLPPAGASRPPMPS